MKISKKDLRRLIYANVISEQQQSRAVTTGARAQNTGPGGTRSRDVEASKRDMSEFVIRVVDTVLNGMDSSPKSFEATFAIGKNAINVFREQAKDSDNNSILKDDLRAIVKEIKDALKADGDITTSRGDLRTGRRFKTNYVYVPNGQSEAPVTIEDDSQDTPEPEPSPSPPSPTPSSNCDEKLEEVWGNLDLFGTSQPTSRGAALDRQPPKVADGFQYPGDTTYRYYVSTANGCWYALNVKTCKFFSLKDFEKNMQNLDEYFVEARDQNLRNLCAGREEGDSVDPADPDDSGKSISPPAPKPSANLTLREEALIMLMAGGVRNTLTYRGADLAILFETGTDDAYREVIAQVKRQTNIKNLQTAVTRFITPKSQPNGLLDLGNVTGGFNYTQAQAQHGAGGALKLALNRGAAFDLPGFDEYGFNRDHTTELRDALGKRLNAPGGTLNESAYGKSRGTLLRERYWGRY